MIDKEGMAPWEVCALCHSLDGVTRMAKFPKLAGQKAVYIEKQFWDFHGGKRTNDGGQMQAVTNEVEAGDVVEIARYFSQLPPPPAADDELSKTGYDRGKEIYHQGSAAIQACNDCHGDPQHLAPWLYGQHRDYLYKQLQDFKSGSRDNDDRSVMRQMAGQLSDEDMQALADYLAASQPRQTAVK